MQRKRNPQINSFGENSVHGQLLPHTRPRRHLFSTMTFPNRRKAVLTAHADLLRLVIRDGCWRDRRNRPRTILHALWTLQEADADFSRR